MQAPTLYSDRGVMSAISTMVGKYYGREILPTPPPQEGFQFELKSSVFKERESFAFKERERDLFSCCPLFVLGFFFKTNVSLLA